MINPSDFDDINDIEYMAEKVFDKARDKKEDEKAAEEERREAAQGKLDEEAILEKNNQEMKFKQLATISLITLLFLSSVFFQSCDDKHNTVHTL